MGDTLDLATITLYAVASVDGRVCTFSRVIDSYTILLDDYGDYGRVIETLRRDPAAVLRDSFVRFRLDPEDCRVVDTSLLLNKQPIPPILNNTYLEQTLVEDNALIIHNITIDTSTLQLVKDSAMLLPEGARVYDTRWVYPPTPEYPPCRQEGWDIAFPHLLDAIDNPPSLWLEKLAGPHQLKVQAWNAMLTKMAVARHFPKTCSPGEVLASIAYYTGLPPGLYSMDELVNRLLTASGTKNPGPEWVDLRGGGELFLVVPRTPLAALKVLCQGNCPDMTATLSFYTIDLVSEKKGVTVLGDIVLGRSTLTLNSIHNSISIQVDHEFYNGTPLALLYGPVNFYYQFDAAVVYYSIMDMGSYYRVVPLFTYHVPVYDMKIVADQHFHGGLIDRYPGTRNDTLSLYSLLLELGEDAYKPTGYKRNFTIYHAQYPPGSLPQGERVGSTSLQCQTDRTFPGEVLFLVNSLVSGALGGVTTPAVSGFATLSSGSLGYAMDTAGLGWFEAYTIMTAQTPLEEAINVTTIVPTIAGYETTMPGCGSYSPPIMSAFTVQIGGG